MGASPFLCHVLELSNYCLHQKKGLAVGHPLSLLPWQCGTVIDKVDKEMLGHAPDRLDLKSPRWSSSHATKSLDNQGLKEKFGSSGGNEQNVIFCRVACFTFVFLDKSSW